MPRPPRRTAAARRGEQKTASKSIHVDSPAPASIIPSSPPITRRTRISNITKSASVLTIASDVETVPSTQPIPTIVVESSGTTPHVSENTILRANHAASARKVGPTSIEVSKTPSPGPQLRPENILATSTPLGEPRGKKRDSKTAFEEDFAASLIAAEDSDGDDENALLDTPTKSSGIKKRRLSQEMFSAGFSDAIPTLLNVMGKTTADKGKRVLNPDETITFNYSSSPERSPAPKTFGALHILEDSDSEPEEEDEQETDENEAAPEPEERAPSRPRRKRAIPEKPQQEDSKHLTTKTLQSLLPKRRAKPISKTISKTKSKSKVTKESAKDKGKAPAKPRAALGDVTKDILDEDELQAIDAPPKPMFGAGMDILSDDELGREIYVDTSARSSSVGAPPTPASPPRRGARGGKGKARAASAEPETGRRPRKTYGKSRRQDSEVSNKENDTPAPGRSRGNLLSGVTKLAEAANVELSKKEKKEVADIRNKFREVDNWDLCFEDVVPSSSDGVVKNGR